MVLLATVATVIASQSVISGAFSVTHQAVQLGFLPRLTIRHTSQARDRPGLRPGRQRAPCSSWSWRSSSASAPPRALASAYGVAVTGTFILNTILFLAVARLLWHTLAPADRARRRRVPDHRGHVLRGQPDEGRARRLAAAGDRRDGLHRADDLAARAARSSARTALARRARCRASSTSWTSAATA